MDTFECQRSSFGLRPNPRLIIYLLRAGATISSVDASFKEREDFKSVVSQNWTSSIYCCDENGNKVVDNFTKEELWHCITNAAEIQSSLLFQCKIKIRKSLKVCSKAKVQKLKLPKLLSRYILLEC